MQYKFKRFYSSILCLSILILFLPPQICSAKLSCGIAFVHLNESKLTLNIKDEFDLSAITSTGKKPTWKSSDAKIASVNTYGTVRAKRAGTVTITAKIANAEASCNVTVKPTKVKLSETIVAIDHREFRKLIATTSNGSSVKWKSNKKSIACVDQHGMVSGLKPGEAIITASADGTSSTCRVTVKKPIIRLDTKKVTLYRGQTAAVTANVSSNVLPKWKSNRKTVASISDFGTITALKHGTATITATVDGVSQTCEVIVEKPTITLNSEETCLKKGNSVSLTASVSSGNSPTWTTSNDTIAIVDKSGNVTAVSPGRCNIYASEDGTKAKCKIHVTK